MRQRDSASRNARQVAAAVSFALVLVLPSRSVPRLHLVERSRVPQQVVACSGEKFRSQFNLGTF